MGLNARTLGQALLHATSRGATEIVGVLVEYGADVNARAVAPSEHGMTPLFLAAHGRPAEITRLLLEHGLDMNLAVGKWTPLMVATLFKNTEVVSLLLEYGADVTAENENGETALSIAAERGHAEIVSPLRYQRPFRALLE